MSPNISVVHATTVHNWYDNRIFEKMVCGLAKRGWRVTYIAQGPIPKDKYPDIDFRELPSGGLKTRIGNNFRVLALATGIGRSIFHFHDPELMLVGLVLRALGWQVVYDVHEDYKLSIRQKSFGGHFVRTVVAHAVALLETFCRAVMHVILAEKAYLYRFPKAQFVLNYPLKQSAVKRNRRTKWDRLNLIYTGTVSVDRGALLFSEILHLIPNAELYIVGNCGKDLEETIRRASVDVADRLHINVKENGVRFSVIEDFYRHGEWAYGLALFPKTRHYHEKELTKFFEYMRYGIPILCSNFPVWKKLVEENGAGICINSEDLKTDLLRRLPELCDRKGWQSLADNVFAAASKYSWDTQLNKLENLYRRAAM